MPARLFRRPDLLFLERDRERDRDRFFRVVDLVLLLWDMVGEVWGRAVKEGHMYSWRTICCGAPDAPATGACRGGFTERCSYSLQW